MREDGEHKTNTNRQTRPDDIRDLTFVAAVVDAAFAIESSSGDIFSYMYLLFSHPLWFLFHLICTSNDYSENERKGKKTREIM